MQLGENIRHYRSARKLTVRKLADAAGASASLVSQLENGRSGASVATLIRIAKALGVTLGDLVGDNQTPSSNSRIVRKAERPSIEWGAKSSKFLITPRPFQHIEAYELVLEPGDQLAELTYGDTFILVVAISGRAILRVSGTEDVLSEGDSASFWTSEPHSVRNIGEDPFRAILSLSPPVVVTTKA